MSENVKNVLKMDSFSHIL